MTRLMVIEDDSNSGRAVQLYLQRRGFEVALFPNAEVGLEELPSFRPEVILCDWIMPGELDGLEFARIVQHRVPGTRFVLVTGMPCTELDAKLQGLPIDRVAYKPISLHTLEELLGELGLQGAPQQAHAAGG